MGKHELPESKYVVKQLGSTFQVVIKASDRRVPGTPAYRERRHAQAHVNRLNSER